MSDRTRLPRLCSVALSLAVLLLTACTTTKIPIETKYYYGPESDKRSLVIALRGLGGSVQDFENYGFVQALNQSYPSFDLVCPDAHFGYYRKRNLLPRLQEDVIQPALAQGYAHIYLVGVSLGGLGSLLSLQNAPHQYDGVILLAPYSGEEELHAEVRQYLAGDRGAPWEKEPSASDQSLADLWLWLLNNNALLNQGHIWLGYGDSDRLSGHDLLAELLPPDRVVVIEGAHRAAVFAELWRQILDRKPFP